MTTTKNNDFHIERIRLFHTKERTPQGVIIGMSTSASEKLLRSGSLQRRLGQMGYELYEVSSEDARDDTYCDVQVEVRPPMSDEHLRTLGHDMVSGALEASWSPARLNVRTEGIDFTDNRLRSPQQAIESGPYVIANSLQYVLQQQKAEQSQLRLVS